MSIGPARSPSKSFYRSPVNSRYRSIEAPGPPPGPPGGEIFHLAGTIIGKTEVPEDLSQGRICGWNLYPAPPTPPQPPDPCEGEPTLWCPGLEFPREHCRFDGTGLYVLMSNNLGILARLNPKNLPCTVKNFDDSQVLIIPAFNCAGANFQQCYNEIIDEVNWQAGGPDSGNCGNGGDGLNTYAWCSLTHTPNIPDVGTDDLTWEVSKAFWPIDSIDETQNRVYFAESTWLRVEDAVQVKNTSYTVIGAEPTGLWVNLFPFDLTPSDLPADLLFLPGIYIEKGTYSSVTDLGDGTVAMNVGQHNVQVGWVFTAWNSDNYFEDYYEVLGVTATTIIIEEYFEPESGIWGAGPNVYDVVTWP